MSFPLLSKADNNRLDKKLGETKCSNLASSIARLYVAINGQWKYTGISGLIAFVLDRETKAQFIRIFDYSNLEMRFQSEVAFCPSYCQESEYFHTMELENDVTVGFLFAISKEENLADEKSKTLTSEAKRFHSKVTSLSYKEDELKVAKESKQAAVLATEPSKRRGSAWGLGGVVNTIKGKIGLSMSTTAIGVVGAPTEFQHLAHIGLNADGTMDIKNIPENWKPYLREAKVRKEDFQNPEAVKIILGTLNSLVPSNGPTTKAKPETRGDVKADLKVDVKNDELGLNGKHSPNIRRPPKKVRARYNYTANSEKEVSMLGGEVLSSLKTFPDGWSRVSKSDGLVGMVPTDYLEDVESGSGFARATPPPPSRTQESPAPPARAQESAPVRTVPNASPAAASRVPPPRPASLRPLKKVDKKEAEPEPVPEPELEPEQEENVNDDEDESQQSRPPNPLLAGIQGFNKEKLNRTSTNEEDEAQQQRPINPLLAGIQSFNAESLNKVKTTPPHGAAVAKPNPLEAIKSGNFNLKKVEKVEKPAEVEKPPVPPEVEGIAGLLKAKLANIRLGVKQEDEEESDGGTDWD